MFPPVSLHEILWLALATLVGGVITGVLAGLFGIGGGAIIVPVLYEIFRVLGVPEAVRMQLCIGTSLAIIVPTSLRAYRTHRSKGLVIPGVIRLWAIPAVLGVGCGAALAAVAPPDVFKLAFVLILGGIGLKILFVRDRWSLGTELPGLGLMSVYGFGIGLGASLMGAGGGSLVNIVLTLYRKPIHNAVATAAGLGVLITLAGAIGYAEAGWSYRTQLPPLSLGFVSLIGLVVMAPVSTLAAPYGARLSHVMSRRTLEVAFSCFILAVAARFLAALF
jgi:uncharacterized membrane protein YfcA